MHYAIYTRRQDGTMKRESTYPTRDSFARGLGKRIETYVNAYDQDPPFIVSILTSDGWHPIILTNREGSE